MNFIVFFLLSISLSFFGNFVHAADTKQAQRPPVQLAKPEIRSITPSAIRTEPGKTVSATVTGAFLDKVTGVAVLSGNSQVSDVQVTLGPVSASSRQASIRVGPNAKPGKYGVRAIGANQAIDVPLNIFSIEVLAMNRASGAMTPASPAAASGKPQTAQPGSTTTPAIEPVVVNTDKITATIKDTAPPLQASQPVVITTEKMTATIKPTASALSANEAVVITTDPLTATIKKTEPGY
jgi:hypothetical protein